MENESLRMIVIITIQIRLIGAHFKRESNLRQEAFIKITFVEFVDGIYTACRGSVAKSNLVGANANYRTIPLKKSLDGSMLFETSNLDVEPKIGYGRVPRTGNSSERGEVKTIDGDSQEEGDDGKEYRGRVDGDRNTGEDVGQRIVDGCVRQGVGAHGGIPS